MELPEKSIKFITFIFNVILRVPFHPDKWKVAEIIMKTELEKDTIKPESYRLLTLLSILSKIHEKLFLQRFKLILKQ